MRDQVQGWTWKSRGWTYRIPGLLVFWATGRERKIMGHKRAGGRKGFGSETSWSEVYGQRNVQP